MISQGILRGLFLAALPLAAAAPRSATAQLNDVKSTCTAINCESKTIYGTSGSTSPTGWFPSEPRSSVKEGSACVWR